MRLPRMTTQRWMILVGVIGLLMGGIVGGVRLKHRHDYFLACVRYHAEREKWWRFHVDLVRPHSKWAAEMVKEATAERGRAYYNGLRAGKLRDEARYARLLDHHASMTRKYRHAARHPWLPVEPDLPEPE